MTDTSPKFIVCSRSGCLRSHFRPSIASAAEQAKAYAALLPLIAGVEIVPAFDRSFPLEEAPEALRHLIEGRSFGKVALTVGALPDLRPYERPLAVLQRRSAGRDVGLREHQSPGATRRSARRISDGAVNQKEK